MIKENNIQKIPVSDSPNTDAFEGIVELYYQLKGYITSSGKWFWYAEQGKQQRGYQDCDVLAINKNETVIISTASNIDDKLSFTKEGCFNKAQAEKLNNFFKRVEEYLKSVPEYEWLPFPPREIKRVVAYVSFPKAKIDKIKEISGEYSILLLSSREMVNFIMKYLDDHPKNIKVQHQILRMLQVLQYNKVLQK